MWPWNFQEEQSLLICLLWVIQSCSSVFTVSSASLSTQHWDARQISVSWIPRVEFVLQNCGIMLTQRNKLPSFSRDFVCLSVRKGRAVLEQGRNQDLGSQGARTLLCPDRLLLMWCKSPRGPQCKHLHLSESPTILLCLFSEEQDASEIQFLLS